MPIFGCTVCDFEGDRPVVRNGWSCPECRTRFDLVPDALKLLERAGLMETREVRVGRAELRAVQTEGGIRLSGHPIVYGVRSVDLGGFTETIAPGAATDALRTSDIRLLINHRDLPLARFRNHANDTMKVEERDDGVHFHTLLDASDPDVQRIIPKIERGDLDGMSFAFFLREGGDTWEGNHRTVRSIAELPDFSIVTDPAYPDTSVALRSLERTKQCLGLPIEDAKRVLALYGRTL